MATEAIVPDLEVTQPEAPEVEVQATETAPEGQQPTAPTDDNPYSAKTSKEYANWLKALKETDPATGKYARIAKDDHSRLYQLHQLEPKGLDGVREKYAILDGIAHGEAKGIEAVGAMQDALRVVEETDQRILSGDPTVLEDFDDEMKAGVVKMAPAILNMGMESDPEGTWNAMLPHFVNALKQSDLVGNFNQAVDILSEKMPSWLPDDKKAAWTEDRVNRLTERLANMGRWLNAQAAKAGEAKPATAPNGKQPQSSVSKEEQDFRKEQSQHHWKTNIYPQTETHANKTFDDLFRPYDKRLKLNDQAKADLKQAFVQRVIEQAKKNPAYVNQMKRFNGQKNPDPKAVSNLFSVEFDRHASGAMKSLIETRYGAFLNGKPKTPATPPSGQQPSSTARPAGPKEFITTTRPQSSDIDFKHPKFTDLRHQNKFPLLDGRIAVLQR